ncbi:hypothetical protein INR49_017960, partial [Caranx melampygus]
MLGDMALSQIQCLDDNHVNPRTHESKPEFLYCEDQRLALEALLRDGREAFFKYLQDRGLRGFLSDPELDALSRDLEPYDPGLELFPANAGDDAPPLSLHYWPDLSDTSVPQMDLGWPDCDAYRGVTRTTVHTQPPLDGQVHIKEVVRKMIGQAQKVIAVVMDVFTDVDIFRDLLDTGFRRRVSVYILLERTTLPHFLSMCQRANMHPGHLKHLRVRCTQGEGFFTRSCTRVKGKLGHRFMFIDGDKALSGSYSFTWMSSRLDRNLITVVTGQAVEAFDRLFRVLFANSSSVDLRQVATEPEPEQEPLQLPCTPALPSAAIARKLYSPKYALAISGKPRSIASSDQNSLKDSVNTKDLNTKLRKKRKEDNIQEPPPLHPGLIGLEKACMIAYLPTWPEPDPPSDVIGFINIRDTSRPTQVHLQRSEMFETSQAIRFSSPFSMPEETLPEVAQPRQLTAKQKEANKPQAAQSEKQAGQSVVDKVQSTQLSEDAGDMKSPASGQKSETEALDTETKLRSDTPTNKVVKHNTTPHLSATTPCLSSNGTSTPNDGNPSTTTHTVPTSGPKPKSPPAPPIPKPRTVQLVFRDNSTSNGLTLPKISVVRSPERQASPVPPVVENSQTYTPDPQSASPDLQMPTPASDGYITSREDSTPSPTSEEFYECSDTPFYGLAFHGHGTPVDNENMTLTNTPDATTTRPACISNTTSDETQSLSGHSRVSTSSSSPERVETGEETEDTNEEDGRKEDEKWKKLSLAEKTTERDSKLVKKRASDVAKKKADDLKQSSQVVKKDKEAQESLKRKRVQRQSSADRQVEGGESREKTDKEKVVDKVRLRPSGVERRDRPVSTKDIDRQKTGASSPPRPSRPLSATWPVGAQVQENHQPNQAECKAPQERSQVLANASPPHKAPSRPPPGAVKSAPGQKQGEVSQQNLAVQQEAEKPPFSLTFGKLYTLKDLKDKMSKLPAMSKKSKTSSPGQ